MRCNLLIIITERKKKCLFKWAVVIFQSKWRASQTGHSLVHSTLFPRHFSEITLNQCGIHICDHWAVFTSGVISILNGDSWRKLLWRWPQVTHFVWLKGLLNRNNTMLIKVRHAILISIYQMYYCHKEYVFSCIIFRWNSLFLD